MSENFSYVIYLEENNKMNKLFSTIILSLFAVCSLAQQAMELKQVPLSRWGIGAANYSGITKIDGNRYAIVSDKEPKDGFFVFRIDQNATTGEVVSIYMEGFNGNPPPRTGTDGMTVRDCEGIAYFVPSNTLFISGEGDQQILEYNQNGLLTGRKLNIPSIFSLANIVPNYGFEALSYSAETHRFWTTTETMLPKDGAAAGPVHPNAQNLLRLQSFDDNLQPAGQYAYKMDRGRNYDFGQTYVFGVPEITALPNGKLVVLEREANISNGYLSSDVVCKLFLVNPNESWQIDSNTNLYNLDPNKFMVKRLLCTFTTRLTPFNLTFANYEGMCLGQKLLDGRQTLLLISDSQGGAGKAMFRLKDYMKVIILDENI